MSQFVNSVQLGLLDSSRVSWAVDNGLLHYDGEDYCLTSTAMRKYTNFFRWVAGNCNDLILNEQYKEKILEPVVTKGRSKMTQSEITDLFSGL